MPAEGQIVAHGGVAVNGDIHLHFAQEVVVELQPLADSIARRLMGQHAACLAEVMRFEVGRNLANRLDDPFAEHREMAPGRLAAQCADGGRHAVDLVEVGAVLPGQVGQVAGPQGRLEPLPVDIHALQAAAAARAASGVPCGRLAVAGKGPVADRGVSFEVGLLTVKKLGQIEGQRALQEHASTLVGWRAAAMANSRPPRS